MDPDLYDDLAGQVALVTGATLGIGREIASGLADRGATVYAGARDRSDLAAEEWRPIELDVTDQEGIEAAIDRIREETGRLDVLVNNAGIGGPSDSLDEASVESIDATLETNLRGSVLLARAALPLLLEREGGRVVNVSSGMGALTEAMGGGSPAYRISKAGLNGLTVYLQGEYGDRGLVANAASPGWVSTDMGGTEAPRSPAEGADTPIWLARFAPGSPGGRFWRDREVIDW
ncbi:short-chain dehydrogenase [Halobacteriales archaeon QS_3_64_16]|nr:MAG: short-chain dehydrogenase [Halobacteriales archaeon QS_3_64_16]